MAVFKCKMCGGNLEAAENTTVCECEYCGTQQTIPKNHDDVVANLFNRANNLRIKSDFDKAQEIYEKIVGSNPEEAEAYWGIILCKYGIEYVEDPATFTKIPTCHRTQLESVRSDPDFLSAIEHADAVQKGIYEKEAEAIDKLQKNILAIVHNEEPFDVFICYKETDESGKRTPDSVIANDIYHQLTNEGFKVFYAAITLEDKLGQAYEPYIFAALNSAKVMLSIGTKPEYFTAVWVKNEWSRFLKIMKNDRSKLLIPCYKDMDAYDLPEEFSHLQAQDMSKIGFISDVIRGIRKVIAKDEPKPAVQQNVTVVESASPAAGSTAPLLKRAFMFLEDGEWETADEYCEKVLDIDPECGQAYLGKLMASLEVNTENELAESLEILSESPHYAKAVRFSDDEARENLEYYNMCSIYNNGCKALSEAEQILDGKDFVKFTEIDEAIDNFLRGKTLFEEVSGFEDADELAEKCNSTALHWICAKYNKNELLKIDEEGVYYIEADNSSAYFRAAENLEIMPDYPPAVVTRENCLEKAELYASYERNYEDAHVLINSTRPSELAKCIEILKEITFYKDCDILLINAENRYARANRKIELDEKLEAIKKHRHTLQNQRAALGIFDGAKKKALSDEINQLYELEDKLKRDFENGVTYN